ncbi:hypothetical protein Tco_1003508 [Tanacetum coccineum]|uniref:Uncharacterized protein n=1 Tax=Tanacetum coccineum TaxID=301880 RepID=A0ABQ5F9M8_9ASTR
METKMALTKDEEADDVDVTPKTSHLNAVKRIFKYLKGKPNLGLWYPRESPFDLEAFSYSNYGGSNLDRKSTTVATSTTEAEYIAAANCCGQVLWVQNQLLDYGFNFTNTKIHIDNESTICIVKNPVCHSKTKHIEIRHHFIRYCYEKKLISVEKIHTDFNVADLLTKPFDGPRFNFLVVSIGQEAPFVIQPQPSSSVVPPTPPTTQPILFEATTILPLSQPAPPTPIAETTNASPSPTPLPAHEPMEHTFEQPSSDQQPSTPRQEAITFQLMVQIDDLEKQLKDTKQTFGKAILTLVEKVKILEKIVTPSKTVNASGEEQVEDISPTTLEAAAILTKVKKIKSVDKGKRYKRKKSSKESVVLEFGDFEEVKSAFEEVNTGGIKSHTFSIQGKREGKTPMTEEEETQASRKTEEQILQEEAGLAEAIRLDALEKALEKEEVAKQVHLDSLLAQRMAEEQELIEEQKKRKAQVYFEAQSYTEEDWDIIRSKLEANAELKKSVLGKALTVEDYAKRMVELVNQRRKHFAEERARAKRNKPMTQTQLRNYMSNFLKNQGTWKLTQLKKLNFDEIARKGFNTNLDRDESEDSDEAKKKYDSTSGTNIPINPVPVATKLPSIANYKIIKKGRKGVYQIVKENGTDMVYISFGAMLTDISRDDLTELYRIVMRKRGMNEPEDEFEKVPWGYLKNMFEEPLSTDSIWSLPGQQRIICWRYYDACRVHCLNLESVDVYMLIERKYPLSAEVCKAMLDKKLQGGKPDEDCYKLLKMMEKQADIRK